MTKSKNPQDHLPKKPTKAELKIMLQQEEARKQKEFADKYQALCQEYGYSITPQLTLNLTKKQ